MNLIHFQGLNCYFNCVVSIATFLGLNYEDLFATLWSETDFSYIHCNNAYVTKRIYTNFEAMGSKLKSVSCASAKEMEEGLSFCPEGGFIIVGMDALYVPWSPIYGIIHDRHYFFAQKEKGNTFVCFDPTYDKKYMRLMRDDITSNAYDLWLIEKVAQEPLQTGVMQEAQAIIRNHPQTQEKLLFEINECANDKRGNAGLLAKYIVALINNRYLFKHYLQNSAVSSEEYQHFFDKDLFSQWEAVKNGLYKISLIRNNENIISEVCKTFSRLINEEMAIAKQMIACSAQI